MENFIEKRPGSNHLSHYYLHMVYTEGTLPLFYTPKETHAIRETIVANY